MNQEKKIILAIIIPAYKTEYLRETLDSLSRQTCQRFTVYIGDDCSPNDIAGIVEEYKGTLNLTYQRFTTNLGGKDLTAQWQRCLNMSQEEEFFCMFSDDDVMMPQNVELFYKKLEHEETPSDVYHFDMDIVDKNTQIRKRKHRRDFPEYLTGSDFYRLLYLGKINARMPEFIFRRKTFAENGGFVRFDLAYRSDNATVMLNALHRPICSIKGSRVLWRDSGTNISSDPALKERKVMASIDFFNWLEEYFHNAGLEYPMSSVPHVKTYVRELMVLYPMYKRAELQQLMERISLFRDNPRMRLLGRIYMLRKIFKKKYKL